MYASSDLSDALAVVRKYDPKTYAAMQASDWYVTTDFDDAISRLPSLDMWMRFSLAMTYTASHAVTVTADNLANVGIYGLRRPVVMLNMQSIREMSASHGDAPLSQTAVVLVHEFRHTLQSGPPRPALEADAYETAARFASLLPAQHRWLADFESTRAREEREAA